jgi:hypothetical protein
VRRLGYQLLGFVVWKLAMTGLRRKFDDAPKKLALGGVAVAVLAALLLAQRRSANGD